MMGSLPTPRTSPAPVFSHTGMDYAGPFIVKSSNLRKAPVLKVYVCIFICFATTAIHLEVAQDLSTPAFLDVLHRFVSRRGRPSHLYSDCGTNFVGAKNELSRRVKDFFSDVHNQQLLQWATAPQGINFIFSPPAAPHFGGIWERAVQSFKYHLTRVVGNSTLTHTLFASLVTRIEAILNSRPLSPLSSDPNELASLTPAHFLIGRPLTSFPEPDLVPTPPNRLTHFLQIQAMTQHFWRAWHLEYLQQLHPRGKWTKAGSNLAIGDLVLVHEPNSPPLLWPMGRITATSPGKDGFVRVAKVKTCSGELSRPVVKLFRLPFDTLTQ